MTYSDSFLHVYSVVHMCKFSGRGHVIIIIIPFLTFAYAGPIDIVITTIVASCYHATKLLYKKLESRLLDYLALSLLNICQG